MGIRGDEPEAACLEDPGCPGAGLGAEGEEPPAVDADAPAQPLQPLDSHDVTSDHRLGVRGRHLIHVLAASPWRHVCPRFRARPIPHLRGRQTRAAPPASSTRGRLGVQGVHGNAVHEEAAVLAGGVAPGARGRGHASGSPARLSRPALLGSGVRDDREDAERAGAGRGEGVPSVARDPGPARQRREGVWSWHAR